MSNFWVGENRHTSSHQINASNSKNNKVFEKGPCAQFLSELSIQRQFSGYRMTLMYFEVLSVKNTLFGAPLNTYFFMLSVTLEIGLKLHSSTRLLAF